jgi:hypothetical protein
MLEFSRNDRSFQNSHEQGDQPISPLVSFFPGSVSWSYSCFKNRARPSAHIQCASNLERRLSFRPSGCGSLLQKWLPRKRRIWIDCWRCVQGPSLASSKRGPDTSESPTRFSLKKSFKGHEGIRKTAFVHIQTALSTNAIVSISIIDRTLERPARLRDNDRYCV